MLTSAKIMPKTYGIQVLFGTGFKRYTLTFGSDFVLGEKEFLTNSVNWT